MAVRPTSTRAGWKRQSVCSPGVDRALLCRQLEEERCELFWKNWHWPQMKQVGEGEAGLRLWQMPSPLGRSVCSLEVVVGNNPKRSCVARRGDAWWWVTWLFPLDNHGNNHLKVNSKFQYTFRKVNTLLLVFPCSGRLINLWCLFLPHSGLL